MSTNNISISYSLRQCIKMKKERKYIRNGIEEIKVSLIADNLIN